MTVTVSNRRRVAKKQGAIAKFWNKQAKNIMPPIIGSLAFLAIWQILSSAGITPLPGPLDVLANERSRFLILNPFYYNSDLDQGLFWQTLASLMRVAKMA
jgi:bicarbonate transport system permease protein